MKVFFQNFRVRVFLHIGIFLVFFTACKKEEQRPEIPYVYVNFSLDPNSTQYINLNAVLGWETVYGGYNGILIFRSSINEFMAFERACPYDPLVPGAQIRVEASSITCFCPICGSKYILTDGSPYEGPSHWPLKPYNTIYQANILYISN